MKTPGVVTANSDPTERHANSLRNRETPVAHEPRGFDRASPAGLGSIIARISSFGISLSVSKDFPIPRSDSSNNYTDVLTTPDEDATTRIRPSVKVTLGSLY